MHNISGQGDLTVVAKHLLFNSKMTNSSMLAFRVQLGRGVKLPTGTFNKTQVETPSTYYKGRTIYQQPIKSLNTHLQYTTRSLDYILRKNNVGLRADFSYRINSSNQNDFRFTNCFNTNAHLFYQIK